MRETSTRVRATTCCSYRTELTDERSLGRLWPKHKIAKRHVIRAKCVQRYMDERGGSLRPEITRTKGANSEIILFRPQSHDLQNRDLVRKFAYSDGPP
jgi:hypothetical protein